MEEKVNETIIALCDWIQKELKNTSSRQAESIFPDMIQATVNLIQTTRIDGLQNHFLLPKYK